MYVCMCVYMRINKRATHIQSYTTTYQSNYTYTTTCTPCTHICKHLNICTLFSYFTKRYTHISRCTYTHIQLYYMMHIFLNHMYMYGTMCIN